MACSQPPISTALRLLPHPQVLLNPYDPAFPSPEEAGITFWVLPPGMQAKQQDEKEAGTFFLLPPMFIRTEQTPQGLNYRGSV